LSTDSVSPKIIARKENYRQSSVREPLIVDPSGSADSASTRTERVSNRVRVPRPLAALLGTVLIVGVTWALLVPPWQSPDENSHFAYVQTVAEKLRLPDETGPIFSTEQVVAADRSNADQTAAQPTVKPEWSRAAYTRWQREENRLGEKAEADGGGPIPSRSNPPLYYAYETPAYWAESGGDIFDRLYFMRLFSVLLLLVTVSATWLLVGELLGPSPLLQFVAAAVVGLEPMEVFISASVNPDAMLFATWALALWLGTRILKRGLTVGLGVGFFGVVAAAILVKGTSYALVPGAFVVLAVGAWRLRPRASIRTATIVSATALALAVPVGGWLVAAHLSNRPAINKVGSSATGGASVNLRGFASYSWQYYNLPRFSFQMKFGPFPGLTPRQVWVDSTWASFGWLEVNFPRWVYYLLFALSALVGLVAVVALVSRKVSLGLWPIIFLASSAISLVVGLQWVAYRSFVETDAPFLQGRYLLPVLPLCGISVAIVLSMLSVRSRSIFAGLIIGALFALQLFSLGLIAGRYYA
jgi:4-amino-4-deoxy-L-arabinose transferase-like glycosyltransferase